MVDKHAATPAGQAARTLGGQAIVAVSVTSWADTMMAPIKHSRLPLNVSTVKLQLGGLNQQ